jgi:DNA (cytosine-5)-methyltransferase 1
VTSPRTYGVKLVRSAPLYLDRHPDAPRRQPWRSWAQEQASRGPIAVDLFSGAGGLSLGLEEAGYTVVLAADHDDAAVQTHMANFPGPCFDLDLSEPERVEDLLGLLEGLDVDLIAGGPPCQPFSRAGRSKIRDLVDKGLRDAIDPRRDLWRAFLHVVEQIKPRAVLMENVPDMALGDDMRTVRYMADRLEAAGYETDMRIVEAWRYGVPQHRQRLLFVGLRDGVLEWPKESEELTLRDAIGDLPKLRDTSGAAELPYRGPKTDFQRRARLDVDPSAEHRIHDHVTRAVREDDREAFELMGQGLSYPELPDRLKRYRDDIFDDKYNRLKWNDRSRSITAHIAKDGYWYIHPSEHRTLTVREAARIQTFPDRFRFWGSRSDAFRLIGNAVPPRLGQVIGEAILAAAERTSSSEDLQASARRAAVRERLLTWTTATSAPPWRRVGQPWAVLVGAMAGRARSAFAEQVLAAFPDFRKVTATKVVRMIATSKHERERRVLHRLLAVAQALRSTGWEGDWAAAAQLGPADRLWVEAVGIGIKHVAATAGTLRVVGRVMGEPEADGVSGRMLLGQVVGHSDQASAITAAIAGVASQICQPVASCGVCPLSDLCLSAGSPAVAG